MASAQLHNVATQDASNGGLILIINPIFVVEIFSYCLFADEVASTTIFCFRYVKKMILCQVI